MRFASPLVSTGTSEGASISPAPDLSFHLEPAATRRRPMVRPLKILRPRSGEATLLHLMSRSYERGPSRTKRAPAH